VAAQRAAAEDGKRAKQLEDQNFKADQVLNDPKLTKDRELTAINIRLHALEEDLKKRGVHLARAKNDNAQLQREIEDLRGTLEMTKRTATQKADEAARLQQEHQHVFRSLRL
jgi:chromosome segregation ATPase